MSPDHLESTCGQWQVWKLRTLTPMYTLWLRQGDKWVPVGKGYDSADEAKAKANG
jgi:hypothetical protein